MAEPLLQRLNQLQLHGMAARYREWQSQQLREPLTAETLLLALIDCQSASKFDQGSASKFDQLISPSAGAV